MNELNVLVLEGGFNEEHEVSLSTGKEVKKSLTNLKIKHDSIIVSPKNFEEKIINYDPSILCFNALHGTYGEDGKIQKILDKLSFKYTHSFLGLGVLMLAGVLWNKVSTYNSGINTKNQIKWLLNMLVLQIGIGYFLIFGGLPSYAKLIHMWLASTTLGLTVYILIDTKLSVIE